MRGRACRRFPRGKVAIIGCDIPAAGAADVRAAFRALGAASLEICLVADGSLDAFGVAGHSRLHPWDYLAGMLIAQEAGAAVADYHGEQLITVERVPLQPFFAASKSLLEVFVGEGIL